MFYREGLLATRPTPKLEDHPSSGVHDCLFVFFTANLLIGGRSSIRNLEDGPCRGDRDPLHNLKCIAFLIDQVSKGVYFSGVLRSHF